MILAELGTIVTGKTPSTKCKEYWNGCVPFVTPKDIQGTKHIFSTERNISDIGLISAKGVSLPPNSICVSCIGNIGYVGKTTTQCISNQQINTIIPFSKVNSDYVYYLIKWLWPFFKNYEGQSTTLSILNKTQFSKIEIPKHSLQQQNAIAAVLNCFDDKIEENERINDNLEQQAAALFKSWFVDYDPWDGIRPAGWTNAPLGTFVEIKRGGSPRPIQDYLSDSGLRWLKISDVTSLSSPFVLEIKEHIKEEGLKKTVFLHAGELVLSNSATPGIPKILDVDTCIHDGWLYFPQSELSKYYLYLFFKHIRKELVSLGNGSVFTNLKTDILKAFPVPKADKTTLKEFDALVSPLFDAMLNANRENLKLATIRNSLLPKLMSGELDVSAIEL